MSPLVVIAFLLGVVLVALVVLLFINRGEGKFTLDIGGNAPQAEESNDLPPDIGMKDRLNMLALACGGMLATLFARLWAMQLVSSDEYAHQAELNRTRSVSLPSARGRILDRNGVEIVTNRPSLVVTAETAVLDDDVELRLLANILGMPMLAARRKIQDQTQGAQTVRTVAIDVSRRAVAYIDEHQYLFDGVRVEERAQRHYPLGCRCAHVVGYTGNPSREQLSASAESGQEGSAVLEPGDIVGQAGVEYQYETILQGVRGEQRVYVDADGRVLDYASRVDARDGSDLYLTIDEKVQAATEKSLESVIDRRQKAGMLECDAGSAVCIDVTNGDIIALASYPTFSPNDFVGGISSDDWNALASEEASNPLMNRAIAGQYPSASTIKPLSTLAALGSGVADLDSSYYCSGFWTGFGSAYGMYCWEHAGHGAVSLRGGIVYSCDCVFYEIGKALVESGQNDVLPDTFRKWGLGQTTGIDLPAEAAGRVPDPEWKYNYFSDADEVARSWMGGDTTNLSIGQGDLLVTPLQMACVYAGLATHGTMVRPHILKGVASRTGSGTAIDFVHEERTKVEEREEWLEFVCDALKGVIYEESEAQASHFTNMRELVAGKTGTAERTGHDPTGWFMAVVPADKPKYVLGACVEQGGYGSECALYVVRDMLSALYDEPDTSSLVDTSGVR